jgi:hypothetical protein
MLLDESKKINLLIQNHITLARTTLIYLATLHTITMRLAAPSHLDASG